MAENPFIGFKFKEQKSTTPVSVEMKPIPLRKPPVLNPSQPELRHMVGQEEGYRADTYLDTKGIPTTAHGYNLTQPGAREAITALGLDYQQVLDGKQSVSRAQAAELLNDSLKTALDTSRELFSNFDSLSAARQATLTDLAYNMGETELRKFPKMLAAINANDFETASKELMLNGPGTGPSQYALDVPNRAKRNADALRLGERPGITQPPAPQAVFEAVSKTPADEAAKVQALAKETRLPLDVVQRNQDRVKSQLAGNKFLQVISNSPMTKEFLSNPQNLSIAHDDVENLSGFENIVRGITGRAVNLVGSLARIVGAGGVDKVAQAGDYLQKVLPLGDIKINLTGTGPVIELVPHTPVAGGTLQSAGRSLEQVDLGYREMTSFDDFLADPLSNFLPYALETGIVSAPDMVWMMTNFPSYVAARTGEIGQTRAVNDGRVDATVEDFLLAMPAAMLSAALDRIGARKILGLSDASLKKSVIGLTKRATAGGVAVAAAKKVGAATVTETTTESAQEAIEIVGEQAGTQGGIDLKESAKRVAAAGVAGAGFGGTVRTATLPMDAYRHSMDMRRQVDELNQKAIDSKLAPRDKAKVNAFQTAVLEQRGITEVSVPAAQIMGYAENHAAGPEAALSALGVDPAALTKALDTNADITFSAKAFVENILGTPAYGNMANNLRIMRGQETVNESIIHLIDQAADLNTALASADVPTNLRARTQKLLDAFVDGDATLAAEELAKALPDVIITVDSLAAKAAEHKTGVEEVVKQGRMRALDSAISDLDQQITDTADALDLATLEGRGTTRLTQKLDTLHNLRAAADTEQANITFPSREPVGAAASEVLRQPVSPEILAENEVLNQSIVDLKDKREGAKLDLARAQMINNKGHAASVAAYISALNKEITKVEKKLADNVADHTPPVSPRNQELEFRALTLDKLKVTITAEKIRAVRQAFRAGFAAARANIKDVQSIIVRLVKGSGLSLHEQAKFLSTLKNIQTSEQLTKQLGVLQSRVLVALEAERRKELNKAIKKILKASRVDKAGQHPVGHLTPETQDLMDAAREIWGLTRAVAQERLDNLQTNTTPDPVVAFAGKLLAIRAENQKAVSNQEVEQVLFDLEEITDFGTSLGKLRSFKKLFLLHKDIQEADTAVTQGKPVETDVTVGFANRLKQRYENLKTQYGGSWMGWTEVLDTLFKKRDGANLELISRLKITKELQKVKGRLIKWEGRWHDIGMEAFGFSDQRQLIDKHHDDTRRLDLGEHVNLNGKKVRLEYSVGEARKLWMEMQDPTVAEAIMHQEGNAYTVDMLQTIFKNLTPQDVKYAEAQLQFYREIYQDINDVYKDMYGVNLPFNDMYSPIARDLGAISDERALTQAAEVTIADEMAFRRSLPGGLRSRAKNLHPLKRRSDIGAMYRHLHDMAHFVETSRKVIHLKGVFSNPKLQKDIAHHHGPAMLNMINSFLEDFGVGYARRGRVFEELISGVNRRFAASVLALKPVIGAKQLTSYFALADGIPSKDFTKYSIEFMRDAKTLGRMLYDSSSMLQQRGSSIDFEVAKIGSDVQPLFDPKRGIPLEHLLMGFIRLGDRAPIYVGGYAQYKHARAQGMSHEDAISVFEEAVNSTQQSNDIDQLSALQRSGAIGRTMTMFMTARLSLLRGELRAIRERPTGLGGRGQITYREFGKRMAYYHFIMPMMIQWMASGFRWETDKQVMAMMMGQLNTFVIFGDILLQAVSLVVTGDKPWMRKTNIPLVDISQEMYNGVVDAIEHTNTEELLDALAEINKAAGEFTGLPLDQARKIVIGGVKIATGEVKEGATLMMGLSEKIAKEAAEED